MKNMLVQKRLKRVEKRNFAKSIVGQDLTARQREILEFIKGFIAKFGFPPTRADIACGFQFASPNASQGHVMALMAKGYLKVNKGARALEIIEGRK